MSVASNIDDMPSGILPMHISWLCPLTVAIAFLLFHPCLMQQRLHYGIWSGSIIFEPVHTLGTMSAIKAKEYTRARQAVRQQSRHADYFLPKAGSLFHRFTAPTSYVFVPTFISASHGLCMPHWLPDYCLQALGFQAHTC